MFELEFHCCHCGEQNEQLTEYETVNYQFYTSCDYCKKELTVEVEIIHKAKLVYSEL